MKIIKVESCLSFPFAHRPICTDEYYCIADGERFIGKADLPADWVMDWCPLEDSVEAMR